MTESKIKVLILGENEQDALDLALHLTRRTGINYGDIFQLPVYTNGWELLHVFHTKKPKVALLCVKDDASSLFIMADTLDILRTATRDSPCRVIVVSDTETGSQFNIEKEARDHGAFAYVPKRDFNRLASMIKSALSD